VCCAAALAPGATWQLQLSGKVDTSVKAQVFDIDLLTNSRSVVAKLRRKHRRVVCYFSAGTNESFRSQGQQYPPETRGEPLADYPDEQWLDIRRIDELKPLIERRLDLCNAKGFVGADFDNVDGYANESGFPLTGTDQLRFNRYLARAAHARGLAAGLKNDLGQVPKLARSFDFAVNEQCFQYHECTNNPSPGYKAFLRDGKPVFQVEYRIPPSRFCGDAKRLGISSIKKAKNFSLNAKPWTPCR
jgi:hypothetical protein